MKLKIRRLLKNNYRLCLGFLKDTKKYILFSCFVFLLSSLIGFIFPVFFKGEIFNYLQTISASIENLSLFEIISFIFFNNLKSAFLALFFGIAFGIIPLVALISNGYILGFVANYVFNQDGIFVLWKILPHGIFELPAILISVAIGLNLGFNVLNKKFKFKEYFLRAIRFFVLVIIPLLIIAAIIEGSLIYFLK